MNEESQDGQDGQGLWIGGARPILDDRYHTTH
jgi:hypothetical protein